MAKRMLADVLWEAANKRLSSTGENCIASNRSHSCEAVALALDILWTVEWDQIKRHPAMRFLKELGCNTGEVGSFSDFEFGMDRQGVRYMWLLLAMHVAEDLGIEI